MKQLGLLCVLAGFLAPAVLAQPVTLRIGDPAPPLQTGKWLQGDPVAAFDSNHVYVILFWASWYGPCQAALARLSDLARKYQDQGLIAFGQDVLESDDRTVPAFVKQLGDQVTCRIALDDKSLENDGAMAIRWMQAAGQSGVPTAFVVDRRGRIAWMGHPGTLEPFVIEKILAGQFDVAALAGESAGRRLPKEQQQALYQKLGQAMKAGNWDAADATVTEIEQALPPSARYQVGPVRLNILLGRRDYLSAAQLAGVLSDAAPNDVYLQNELAWNLATANGVDLACLVVAHKAAERANAAAGGKIPGVLDTLARTQFMIGQTNEAVATEQQAVAAESDEGKAVLRKCLAAYRHGRLPDASP
jgi:thiol-disulfide isomerase/thioredoxin